MTSAAGYTAGGLHTFHCLALTFYTLPRALAADLFEPVTVQDWSLLEWVPAGPYVRVVRPLPSIAEQKSSRCISQPVDPAEASPFFVSSS